MPIFHWTARDFAGDVREGTVSAGSWNELSDDLIARKAKPLLIVDEQGKALYRSSSFPAPVKTKPQTEPVKVSPPRSEPIVFDEPSPEVLRAIEMSQVERPTRTAPRKNVRTKPPMLLVVVIVVGQVLAGLGLAILLFAVLWMDIAIKQPDGGSIANFSLMHNRMMIGIGAMTMTITGAAIAAYGAMARQLWLIEIERQKHSS